MQSDPPRSALVIGAFCLIFSRSFLPVRDRGHFEAGGVHATTCASAVRAATDGVERNPCPSDVTPSAEFVSNGGAMDWRRLRHESPTATSADLVDCVGGDFRDLSGVREHDEVRAIDLDDLAQPGPLIAEALDLGVDGVTGAGNDSPGPAGSSRAPPWVRRRLLPKAGAERRRGPRPSWGRRRRQRRRRGAPRS